MRFTLLTSIVSLAVLTAAAPQPAGKWTGMSIPITKRSGFVNPDGSANFEALNGHLASTEAKILRGFENFEKNTGAPHPGALKTSQKRATGSVPLTDYEGSLWYGTISVGTRANDFTVDFDTGSSDLFLPRSDCSANCDGHNKYDPSASSTSVDLGRTFHLEYGDESSVDGEIYTDTVTVAGLTATKQALGAATKYSDGLAVNEFPPDGLMGMAFESISSFGEKPVFQTLVSEGQTDEAAFSFKLAASADSELYLGGANQALYTGDFTYVPVTTEGYWEVTIDSIDVNGKTVMSNVDSIIDTGTSLIAGVPSQVADFYSATGGTGIGNGYYTWPCDSFPSVNMTFGGASWSISSATLNLGAASAGSSDCVSGIVGHKAAESFWIIGDVFLQNVYTKFDVANSQVGFAKLA